MILYRYNNFFANIEDFIQTYNLGNYDISVYNCTENDIEYENTIKTDKKIETIIKSIYQDNNNKHCIILDTCIKYIDFKVIN